MHFASCSSPFQEPNQLLSSAPKLKTEPHNDSPHRPQNTNHHAYQAGTNPASSKKIKIRGHHHRTEVDREPSPSSHFRFKTGLTQHAPLCDSVFNLPETSSEVFKHKKPSPPSFVATEGNKENTSQSELMPNPRRIMLSFSRCSRMQQSPQPLKQQDKEDRSSSKSKKKIEFTVFEGRSNTKSKSQKADEKKKSVPSLCSVPYPCTRNIVIDLFEPKTAPESKSKEKRISRFASAKSGLNRSLSKGRCSMLVQEKVRVTRQKLERLQIYREYGDKREVDCLLQSFWLAGQPECKWVLLVVDELFRRMRQTETPGP